MSAGDPGSSAVRPSILLMEAAHGGIVNNERVAKSLTRVVLRRLASVGTLAEDREVLGIEALTDRWGLRMKENGRSSWIEITKRDAAVSRPSHLTNGQPLLSGAAVAKEFAEILIKNLSREGAGGDQLPLSLKDKGSTWMIDGSHNADRAVEGTGLCHVEIQKKDCRVVDLCLEYVLHVPSVVKQLLRP